jgi:predicted metal-dependent hydrolase
MQAMTQLTLQFDAPPVKTMPGSSRIIQLSNRILTYRFVRRKRRTIGLVIGPGGLEARAPRYAPISEVESFIRLKEKWITGRLSELNCESRIFRWREGELLPFFGGRLRLQGAGERHNGLRRVGDILEIGGPADENLWRTQTMAWIRDAASQFFSQRVAHYSARLGEPVPTIGLSNARTQWGSCGADRKIRLNWRLALVPVHLIDYVVAHELGHLVELNHSSRFWAVVAKMYPDHRNARKELNRLGASLPEL